MHILKKVLGQILEPKLFAIFSCEIITFSFPLMTAYPPLSYLHSLSLPLLFNTQYLELKQ